MASQHHLARQAERHLAAVGGDQPALSYDGRWYTRVELHDRAGRVAAGLQELGVAPGDRVVAVMANSPDVGVLYHAVWRAGAVATPAIFLLPPPELRNIIVDAGAGVVVVSAELLPGVQAAVEGLDVRIVVDGVGGETHPTLDELATRSAAPVVDRNDDDLAALMYTGGTTGRAKGVMLTHANLWHAGRSGHEAAREDGHYVRTLVPLPLAHAFGLLVTAVGMHNDADQTSVLMRWFDAAGCIALIEQHGVDQATLVPTMLRLLLDQPLEDHDLSSLQRVVSGSAPLPAQVRDAFEERVPSVVVCEGYGLTETTAATCVNRPDKFRFGSVGPAVPNTSLKIAEDGEILIKGVGVFRGYFKKPEDTKAVLNADGWFATGDIGEIDADGFLRITDRKKDLIVTAGGKNIAPQYVEAKLKTIPLLSQVMVHGDKRKFVSALVTLNPDEVKKLGMSYEEAVKSPKVRELIEAAIKERNKELESYQQVKKFAVLEKDLTIDSGDLTPTLKVKRKVVTEKHKAILDAFYVESASDAA